MARHLTKVADSGAQDSNKFPSNIYNHNDSFKLTDKNTTKIDADEEMEEERSKTPLEAEKHIPVAEKAYVSDCRGAFEMADMYKRTWGIPLQCKLAGGGESTLNSSNAGPISNSANNNSPSTGASGANNSNSNWPAGHNPTSTGVVNTAWNPSGNGSNSGGRQQVGTNPTNNASHPSNTSQNTGKLTLCVGRSRSCISVAQNINDLVLLCSQ